MSAARVFAAMIQNAKRTQRGIMLSFSGVLDADDGVRFAEEDVAVRQDWRGAAAQGGLAGSRQAGLVAIDDVGVPGAAVVMADRRLDQPAGGVIQIDHLGTAEILAQVKVMP